MTPLQSGAYQSKILGNAVRQTRHWVEQGQIALRRLRTAATWGAQILLYPAYVAFQTVRLAVAQVRLGLELGLPAFRQALRSNLSSSPAPITPDATEAIVPTVDTPLQQTLKTIQTFPLPVALPVSLSVPSVVPPGNLVIRAISALQRWTRSIQKQAAPVAPAAPASLASIRGVATLLETRSLVLVTHQNEILDILTPTQQAQLRGRIIGAVADYQRYLKIQSHPLLASSSALVRTVRPLWKKTRSQFRFLAALLYAIVYAVRQITRPPAIAPQLAGTNPARPLVTADLPLQQALQMVQQLSLPAAPGYLRGLACQRDTRSLVLVTDQNQIVDYLSAEQQTRLRQRIAWDTAHYGRYRQIRQQARCAFARLQTHDRAPHLLPPVRVVRRLMAWMQRSPVAIAANLFQEASLVLIPRNDPAIVGMAIAPLPLLSLPAMAPVRWATAGSTVEPSWTPQLISPAAAVERSNQGSATHAPNYIETEATLLGYVQTPIEAVLRWLDRGLLWLEQAIVQLWRWFCQTLGTKDDEKRQS